MALVEDKHVFYLVLNRNDNKFDFKIIKAIEDCLDIVEKSTGPKVLVTIGTGQKIFSSGFDLDFWKKDRMAMVQSIVTIQGLFARFLTLSVPTMCVMNGHTIAGGLLLSLCHDFRIMREDYGFICLSEINIGISLTPSFAAIVRNSLDP